MNVSSVKNLNGETFSAVQDAELTEVVQTNSATWGQGGSTPTYDYTDNNLISAIDTSALYAASAGTAASANRLLTNGTMGANVKQSGYGNFYYMPPESPFGKPQGIFSPLQYATGACLAMSGGSFGAYYKGNEWYVSNPAIGQALRGETHGGRGVHLSGTYENGLCFDLSVNHVSGKSNTAENYNWKLERGCVSGKGTNGEWRYGPAEDTVLRTASAWNETISSYQNASATYLTAVDIPYSATWNDTTDVVQTNSGSWDRISALSGYSANGWNVKLTAGPTIIANSNVITASGIPQITGYLTVRASNYRWVTITDGGIYLRNSSRSPSAQYIRPDTIYKWNNYATNKLNVSDFKLSSLNDANVNNIVVTASLPSTPDANTLYLIPET